MKRFTGTSPPGFGCSSSFVQRAERVGKGSVAFW
jgi:hypothetical protein